MKTSAYIKPHIVGAAFLYMSLSLNSCSWYMDMSNRIGEKMPTYDKLFGDKKRSAPEGMPPPPAGMPPMPGDPGSSPFEEPGMPNGMMMPPPPPGGMMPPPPPPPFPPRSEMGTPAELTPPPMAGNILPGNRQPEREFSFRRDGASSAQRRRPVLNHELVDEYSKTGRIDIQSTADKPKPAFVRETSASYPNLSSVPQRPAYAQNKQRLSSSMQKLQGERDQIAEMSSPEPMEIAAKEKPLRPEPGFKKSASNLSAEELNRRELQKIEKEETPTSGMTPLADRVLTSNNMPEAPKMPAANALAPRPAEYLPLSPETASPETTSMPVITEAPKPRPVAARPRIRPVQDLGQLPVNHMPMLLPESRYYRDGRRVMKTVGYARS